MSTPLQTPAWPQLPDGFVFPRSSILPEPQKSAQSLVVKSAVTRGDLSTLQKQMVLGTLLGDGYLTDTSYGVRHGLPQTEYMWAKYHVLSEFVLGSPSLSAMSKLGYSSVGFLTAAAPVFKSLRALTYPGGIKTVTPKWLDMIDEAGFLPSVAWWVSDDGSLIQSRNPRRTGSMMLCTHGFQHPEVELLIEWLSSHGYKSRLYTSIREGYRPYPTIILSAESTDRLAADLRGWTHPSMMYKLEQSDRILSQICMFCGKEYGPGQESGRKYLRPALRPWCGSEECWKAKKRLESLTYGADPEYRATRNSAKREKYHDDPEYRLRITTQNAIWAKNNREAMNEASQRCRAKKKAKLAAVPFTCPLCLKTETLADGHVDRTVCTSCRPRWTNLSYLIRYHYNRSVDESRSSESRKKAADRVQELGGSLGPILFQYAILGKKKSTISK